MYIFKILYYIFYQGATVLHELIHVLGAIHEQNRFEDLNFSIVCQNLFE